MRFIGLCLIALLAMPFLSIAAEDPCGSGDQTDTAAVDLSQFRIVNPDIDAWAQGTVTNLGIGTITVHGTNMPYATVHAQMRAEAHDKLAGIDDPQQRLRDYQTSQRIMEEQTGRGSH